MEKEAVKSKTSLFAILFTFAVDSLGATIVFPVFAPLFLKDPSRFFSPDTAYALRTLLLGVFLGVYPLMQFIFSPILGEVSDHFGRKRALILTVGLTFFGYALSAMSIRFENLSLLFVGRLVMGLGASNLSVCLSTMTDLSSSVKQRSFYFSMGSMVAGLTFILGPFIGGKLSDPTISRHFNLAFPMVVGSLLSFINLIVVIFVFFETLLRTKKTKYHFLSSFSNIAAIMGNKEIRRPFLVYFFYLFSWNIVLLFIPAYSLLMFGLDTSSIGNLCALLGLFWILGTSLLYHIFSRFSLLRSMAIIFLICFAILMLTSSLIQHLYTFVIVLGFCIMFAGFIWPYATHSISSKASEEVQGKVMGLSQSIFSLTMMLASVTGGLFLNLNKILPFAISSVSAFLAAIIMLTRKTRKKEL